MRARAGEGFRYRRRVQFHETDLAGVVHFSWYFRYMEEAEHALWRAAGLTIDSAGADTGWPRVSAAFDYRRPLRFEDEVDILVRVEKVTRRTIHYGFDLASAGTAIGSGTLVAAHATRGRGAAMQATDVPADIVARLRAGCR